MTIQKLRYMIEVVNSGTISHAAKKLFVSQPSLSNAIQELETELGFDIFRRTNTGVMLTPKGTEFLGYARQVVEQADLLEQRYFSGKSARQHLSISTQHYAFVVKAFVNLVHKYALDEYDFSFRDTRTHEILEDVRYLRSEIGVIYLNTFNEKVIGHLLKEYELVFHPLFVAAPHVFVGAANPLAKKDYITLEDLDPYPRLSYEQGEYNSFYYSEEILSTLSHKKNIIVSDRATIFNLMIGLNGYTISTGVINSELNGDNIVAVPLKVEESITVGWICHKKVTLTHLAELFLEELKRVIEVEQLKNP